jgi:hypothetical protein
LIVYQKTLAFPLFVKLIKTIPTVTKIYANYLNKNHLWDELILFYNELGQQKEALMIMLKQAYSLSEVCFEFFVHVLLLLFDFSVIKHLNC